MDRRSSIRFDSIFMYPASVVGIPRSASTHRPRNCPPATGKTCMMLIIKLAMAAAFTVVPGFGAHQLSNVEKRHHELGAQRNELFAEMQELLKQQQDEVLACRMALAELQQKTVDRTDAAAVCSAFGQTSDTPLESEPLDQIATITEARRASKEGLDVAEDKRSAPTHDTESADFANYFYSYAELDHQKQMLEDGRRMEAYRNSMFFNKDFFAGKTVLDVGSGSGVLAIFAAQAGAKKVYAVEYTDMAKHARTLVHNNGFGDVIEVIQESAESVQLPEKVDIIVSEWMGYFLLRESMLDSVVVARDKWLKDDGVMFPSHASMIWAAVDDRAEKLRKDTEFADSMHSWSRFSEQAMSKYGIDMTVLEEEYESECMSFFGLSSAWRELDRLQVITNPVTVKELDLHTCTLDDTKGLSAVPFSFKLKRGAPQATGFAGWFDISFRGRDNASSLSTPVNFSTSPSQGYTHWGQQVFYMREAVPATVGEPLLLEGEVSMVRQANNPRLYNVKVDYRVKTRVAEDSGVEAEVESTESLVYKLS